MRNLLPYEHALIEALGISEEEYFIFRKAQREYKDPKTGTILDIRNEPVSTIALILSIVGTVAQVAAALLAPRPEAPDQDGGGRRARDKRFAPRYGFDSLQNLAQYGETVNLVYCQRGTEKTSVNDALANPDGGVRAGTSLLWSAVYSFGNAQYIQMMAAIGAGEIVDIDYNLTAVGQTLIKLFQGGSTTSSRAATWQYFRNSGPILISDKKRGSGQDPRLAGVASSRTVYDPLIDATTRSQGFSQAFSPSSSREFGITAPIPIFMNVIARNEKGENQKAPVRITAGGTDRTTYWPDSYATGGRRLIPVGATLTITIAKAKETRNEGVANNFADDIRESSVESLELGALYKLGSAKFEITNISGDTDISKTNITATIQCVEAGMGPFGDYETEDIAEQVIELEAREKELEDLLNVNIPNSYEYQLSHLSESSYFITPDWSAKQVRLLERVRVKRDQLEQLYETAVSFNRNRSQMDELVLQAEEQYGGKQFSQTVLDYANNIQAVESNLEDARDQKERINGNIERLGSTPERESNLKDTKNVISQYQKELKSLRSKLATALRETGFANGFIDSQVDGANGLTAELKSEFRSEFTVNGVLLPEYNKIFSQVDPLFASIGLGRTEKMARKEREALRKLKNIYAKIENLLLQLGGIDYDKFNAEKARLNQLIANARAELESVKAQLSNPDSFNDHLGTKCLVRLHEAEYETLSPVNLVHFSLKAKVFMRIQGRASKYGEVEAKKYSDADNGCKPRTAMFRVYYKRPSDTVWKSPNVIFCVRKTYDKDAFIPLIFRSPDDVGQKKWQFRFEPVFDAPSESKKAGAALNFVYLVARGPVQNIDNIFFYQGNVRAPGINNVPPKNKSPFRVDEWMIFSAHADTSIQYSFDNGPEFAITAVSEQQFENLSSFTDLYKNIATIGLNAYSGVGLTSMRNLSVFVNKGKKVRLIELSPPSFPSTPNGPSCFASDIFLDTVLDRENGIGAFVDGINANGLDITKLALSKAFCMKRSYFMDGVIAARGSWRAFWSEVAPYSLLELARIGGKETLIPAVPTTGDGTFTRNVTISALFNQGNILEDSYKEEFLDYGESTQDLIATVVYRDQANAEPFPRNTSVTIKLKDAEETLASRQTFDLSDYVTNRNQAINYAMLLVQQRRHSRRAVEFKTFPTEAPIAPGSYVYVHMEENQWNDIHSGAVLDDGTINIPFASETINGTYDTLIYEPGKQPFKQSIAYVNGQSATLSAYKGKGVLFVLGTQVQQKRVFRVTEVAMEEEGEITIRAIEHPCIEEAGQTKSLIANFDASLFFIG
jgi:hypothetical protein